MLPRVWRCGRFEIHLDPPAVMGILNVTPDSFSDGGRFYSSGGLDVPAAIEAAREMFEQGAALIDVGGESTRPGAPHVPVEEETARVVQVVRSLARDEGACVSVDTHHAEVAEAALAAGASVLNDVAGFRDQAMVGSAVSSDCGLVVMHMRGTPADMQQAPEYDDVVAEVRGYLERTARMLEGRGVAADRICVDPGIGFGKTAEHNLRLLRELRSIAELGYPVMVGVSRKAFVGSIVGGEPAERLHGSLAAAACAVLSGASVVRAHDVAATVRAVRVAGAIHAAS